jgi:hypothetical protein
MMLRDDIELMMCCGCFGVAQTICGAQGVTGNSGIMFGGLNATSSDQRIKAQRRARGAGGVGR